MQLLVYIISYPILWCIASLPFRLFYAFSDFIYTVLYRIVRYRRKVVRENLELVFPEKDGQEISLIEKEFYRHMCDVFLETVKTMKIRKKDMEERYKIVNPEILVASEEHKSVLLLIPHYGNWEWSITINQYLESKGYAVYQKIGNKYFDRLIKKIRARWNTTLLSQKEMIRTIVRNENEGQRAVYGIVSDQSPQWHRTRYWRPFLNITVPVFESPEMLARKFNLAVFYTRIEKIKRGYYQLEFVPICEEGADTQEHEITDRFFELTEDSIRTNPPYYLWTHRRWKHRDKVPEEFQISPESN